MLRVIGFIKLAARMLTIALKVDGATIVAVGGIFAVIDATTGALTAGVDGTVLVPPPMQPPDSQQQ